jgi:hypothetical protein
VRVADDGGCGDDDTRSELSFVKLFIF